MTEGSDKSRGQHLSNTMAKPSRAPTDPPTVQLCALVNSLTGVSARRLRQAFPGRKCENLWSNHFWSPALTSMAERRERRTRRGLPVTVLLVVLAVTMLYVARGYTYGPVFLSLVVAPPCATTAGS